MQELAIEKDLFSLIQETSITSSLDNCKVIFNYILDNCLVLYKAGYAHLDIKLENIVLSRNEYLPKFIDFGSTLPLHKRAENDGKAGTQVIGPEEIVQPARHGVHII